MKKILLPLLAIAMFSSLSSKGFQFWNKTGRSIKLGIEAHKYTGKMESRSVELQEGQVYTREDFNKIEEFRVTTVKRGAGFFASEKEVQVIEEEEILNKIWKRDIKSKEDKIGKIKIFIKDDNLRYKKSWINDPKCKIECAPKCKTECAKSSKGAK